MQNFELNLPYPTHFTYYTFYQILPYIYILPCFAPVIPGIMFLNLLLTYVYSFYFLFGLLHIQQMVELHHKL